MKKGWLYFWIVLVSAVLALPAGVMAAEKYPTRPIKIVVAWGAGSSQDIPQRIAAEEAKSTWGSPLPSSTPPAPAA